MAIAHICHRCGHDLARIRARLEACYGLPIVECPGCGRVAVRRRHPIGRFWATFRRFDWTLTVLAANLAGCALTLAMMISMIAWFTVDTVDQSLAEVWRRDAPGVVFLVVFCPLIAGAWITLGLGHWRRPVAWITFGGLVMLGLTAVAIAFAVNELDRSFNDTEWLAALTDTSWLVSGVDLWIRAVALLYLLMLVATAGVWPGRGAGWLLRQARRGLWRWRRRRATRERRA